MSGGGVSLLQSLAGGQWFIGSVVCPSVRCGAVHRSGSMGVSVVRSCFNLLQVDSGSSARRVSMSGRYGSNMAMWFGVSLRPCFYSLQVIKR